MASRKQAEARLAKLGFELDRDSGPMPLGGFSATIDAIGRYQVNGECRGQVVYDYTAKASEFWQMVIDEALSLDKLTKCQHDDCEFHEDRD